MTSERLVAWRLERGLSQIGLAAAVGCSRRAIVNWETGAYPVPRYIALACAAIAKKLKPAE